MERLQKVIANAGVCSRRKAEQLITEGKVKVKNMGTGEAEEVELEELIEFVYEARLGDVYSALEGAMGDEFSNCTSLNIPPEINF